MTNPLRGVMDIRRDELPLALLMFGYFFLVITSFWILKPIKKGLFIQFYDAGGFNLLGRQLTASQAELIAKTMNMVGAFAAVGGLYSIVQEAAPPAAHPGLLPLLHGLLCGLTARSA